MKIKEIFFLSLGGVRSNKLRTGITSSIIAFGIMALVGINTAIEAMKQKFTESFAAMGANGFTIRYRTSNFFRGGPEAKKKGQQITKKSNLNKVITIDNAEDFKQNFKYPAEVSLSLLGGRNAVVSMNGRKTNPIITIMGGDENYASLNGFTIIGGRNLTEPDIRSGRSVCILGHNVRSKFFSTADNAIGQIIKLNNIPYQVIGVFDSKGSSMGGSMDDMVLTSYNNIRRFFNSNRSSFSIGVKVENVNSVNQAVGEAEGVFRGIRKLSVFEESNFRIDKSDRLVELILTNLRFITWSAVIIGIITLFGAAIGLMNIMLVSVNERTREIGLIKAIGGKQSSVRRQFLYESIIICLIGAFLGIILGILLGNVVSLLLQTSFVLPRRWVLFGMIICLAVGILAGLYPSFKASRMNPIQALRYE